MPAINPGKNPYAAVPRPKAKPKTKTVRVKAHPHVEVHIHVSPSPDARDVTSRSPATKRHDRAVSNRNIRQARSNLADVGGGEFETKAERKQRHRRDLERQLKKKSPALAAIQAPVLKVLDQTTRPLHAIANETLSDVKRRGVKEIFAVHPPGSKAAAERRHALTRGIENKDRTTFSNVLGAAGWNPKSGLGKFAKGATGLAADIAADPLTYTTGGAGTVAERAALNAGRRVERKALKKGLSKDQAAKFGDRARTQTLRKGDQTKGATVKFAGMEVPGVRRATAVASKPVRKAGRKATPNRVRVQGRGLGADLNPNITPTGATREQSRAAIMATRTARAKASHGMHIAQEEAIGLAKNVKPDEWQQVLDAIEAGDIKSLPPELRQIAKRHVSDKLKYANRLRRQAGIKGGTRRNYVPHYLTEEALSGMEKPARTGIGRRVVKPASSKARKRKGTLAELRVSHPGEYREDLPGIMAQRMGEGYTSQARAELNRSLADTGRTLAKGKPITLGDGESVYHLRGSDLPEKLTAQDAAKALRPLKKNKRTVAMTIADRKPVRETYYTRGSKKGGRYVALNDEVVKRALEGASPELKGHGAIHLYDKTQGGFKRLAIATPGFHVRNIVGDMWNAYEGQGGHRIIPNLRHASKTLKAYGRQEKALRNLTPAQVGATTFHAPAYGKITYDEAAKQLRDHGAFRSGYIARELPELSASGKDAGRMLKLKTGKVPQSIKRKVLGREDLPRLVTAMEALRHGATYAEAAEKVATLHFDYQHLTEFERQFMRRALPFYTWNARNIPLQAKKLVTNPGKFANYQKVREEAQGLSNPGRVDPQTRELYRQLEAAGVKLPGGYEKYLSEYEQRNAGIPISWKGHKFTLSAGLPLQDLNELPGVAGAREYGDKAMSLVSPLVKDPVELGFNYSFFFRDQIERDTSPMVAAPAYVGAWPEAMRKKFRVAKIRDKRSGRMVWGWPGKVDYAAHVVPGIPNYAQQFATPGTDRRGKGFGGKALAFSGIRSIPIDPVKNAVDLAYSRQRDIRKRLAELGQQGVGRDNPSAEWRKLNDQLKITTQIAYQGKAAQGYKVLPTQGGPPKRALKRGFQFDSKGSGDFDFSGGKSQEFDFSG